jgi:hypothetical protein
MVRPTPSRLLKITERLLQWSVGQRGSETKKCLLNDILAAPPISDDCCCIIDEFATVAKIKTQMFIGVSQRTTFQASVSRWIL